jgi:hypothetical protein
MSEVKLEQGLDQPKIPEQEVLATEQPKTDIEPKFQAAPYSSDNSLSQAIEDERLRDENEAYAKTVSTSEVFEENAYLTPIQYEKPEKSILDHIYYNYYTSVRDGDFFLSQVSSSKFIDKVAREEEEFEAMDREDLINFYEHDVEFSESEVAVPFAHAVAEAATYNRYPEVGQAMDESSNLAKTVYTVSSLGLNFGKAAVGGTLLGGGYWSFVASQSLNEGVSLYNEMDNLKLSTGNEDITPLKYGLFASMATLGGGYASQKFMSGVYGKLGKSLNKGIFFDMSVGAAENILQEGTETLIRDGALIAAGEDSIGTNLVSMVAAGLFGAAGGYGRNRANLSIMKDLGDKSDNFIDVEGFLKSDTLKVLSDTLNSEKGFARIPEIGSKNKIGAGGLSDKQIEQVTTEINQRLTDDIGVPMDSSMEVMLTEIKVNNVAKEAVNDALKHDIRRTEVGIESVLRKALKQDVINSSDPDSSLEVRKSVFKEINNSSFKKLYEASSKLDDVNLGDPVLNKAFRESKDFGEFSKKVEDSSNLRVFHSLYKDIEAINEAMGGAPMEKMSHYTKGENTLADKNAIKKFAAMKEKYIIHQNKRMDEFENKKSMIQKGINTVFDDINKSHRSSVNPLVRKSIEELENNLRYAGGSEGNLKTKVDNFYYGGDGDSGYRAFIKNNSLNEYEIRRYLDQLRSKQDLGEQIILEDSRGDFRFKYDGELKGELGLSELEVMTAHKISNHTNNLNDLDMLVVEGKSPINLGEQIDALKSFGAESFQYPEKAYHATHFNAKGKSKIQDKSPKDVEKVYTSRYRARSIDRKLASNDDFRENPIVESQLTDRGISNHIVNYPIYKSLENAVKNHVGFDVARANTTENGRLNIEGALKSKVAENDPVATGLMNVYKYMETKREKAPDTPLILKPVTMLGNLTTKAVISQFRYVKNQMNLGQVVTNLSAFIPPQHILKTLPKGEQAYFKYIIKHGSKIDKSIKDTISSTKDDTLSKVYKNYFQTYFAQNGLNDHIMFGKQNKIRKGRFEELISDVGEKVFGAIPDKIKPVFRWLNRSINDGYNSSDFGARVWGIAANKSYLDDTFKRFNWKGKDVNHNVNKFNKLCDALQVDFHGDIASTRLRSELIKGLKDNDLQNFYNLHTFYMIDKGLYHYNSFNKQHILNKARSLGEPASQIVRFSSWPMYDAKRLGSIAVQATKGHPRALVMSLIMGGIGYAGWEIADEVFREKSKTGKAIKTYSGRLIPGKSQYDRMKSLYGNTGGLFASSFGAILDVVTSKSLKKAKKSIQKRYKFLSYKEYTELPDWKGLKKDGRDIMRAYTELRDIFLDNAEKVGDEEAISNIHQLEQNLDLTKLREEVEELRQESQKDLEEIRKTLGE